MVDNYERYIRSPTTPGAWVNITPADSDLGDMLKGILIGTDGILRVTTVEDDGTEVDQTIAAGILATGIFHPGRIKRVWATTTTATNIVGQY